VLFKFVTNFLGKILYSHFRLQGKLSY